MTANTILSINKLQSGYGSKQILFDIDMELEQGLYYGLLGLNGCGKTTLLRSICGLLPYSAGSCKVGDKEIRDLNDKQRAREIAYVPQRHSPITGLTVTDVVLMGFNPYMGIFDAYSKQQKAAVHETLVRLGMVEYEFENFAHLSEGQKQKIILGRMMVQNTPIVMMDEPDSALDFVNKHMVLKLVSELMHSEQKAGLVTLHDPNFALAYCDKLFLMKQGRIVAQIDIHSESREEIETKLRLIYGDINLLLHNGHYAMLKI